MSSITQPTRHLIGLKVFSHPEEFESWQREAPREIYEITPTNAVTTLLKDGMFSSSIKQVIFVTYNAGIIGGNQEP